ncbi:aspartate--tRNA(Asn) ligase [Clostridium thermosuccinogenes]|uniref:Aspartate--tRNA ligase n=1 Tax=Clostridium thermosuccinogenes TaxID=84032 RepID=A0A2K2FBT1_9CLOT|nr:aspartate--tRNA(Asn) ligase [Pseudoclostridium thermosuccinogenes]AUS95060.1 aspartate--tRNA(Asn) ligase [Pseudoclostridium thermosuccinogenes]PNT96243.1 aspartate--tRNA(Asn) ligase [Pseudoclostridium thermosuccinogenes]PNT97925.1 aspartate--tRNA(Asn) ligase [Pseudoclostridium thermosuccinogenes]
MLTLDGLKLKKCITIDELKASVGQRVAFSACVHKIRYMSGFAFVILRTGRYLIQSVHDEKICTSDISALKEGCYINITGQVKEDKRANYQLEIILESFDILSLPEADYPLHVSNKHLGCSIETNLEYRSVALRNPYERAAFKISEGVVSGFREFMLKEGFTEIHSPKIVAAGAEGGANIFTLKYFDKNAFLAQSPQFYKQTCVAFFDRVFEIGPVYRAERHNTTRHLNEYIGLDFEMGFIDDMTDVMNMETAMLKHILQHLREHYKNELEITGAVLPEIDSIPVLTFFEALEAIGSPRKYDLEPEDEVKLCNYAKEKFGSEFIFITHFPAAKRPFYAMNDPENDKLALSFDLLFRGLEITTGGQRIHNYKEQVAKMQKMGLNPDDFRTYLDIFKYGMPPHGGLGIGLERLVMKLLDLQNIRQASLFPRDLTHLDP